MISAGQGSIWTALIAIRGVSMVIADAVFQGLQVPQDTLLLVSNSSVRLQNTSFADNTAVTSGAFAALAMQQVSIRNSTITSNTGIDPPYANSSFPLQFWLTCLTCQLMHLQGHVQHIQLWH